MQKVRTTSNYLQIKQEQSSEGTPPPTEQKQDGPPQKKVESESDDVFELQYHTMKKLHLPINRKLNRGPWTLQENRTYLNFLENNLQSFRTEAHRREDRVFCRLSEALHRKRTPDQCRSHHQKLQFNRKSIEELIVYLRGKIDDCDRYSPFRRKVRLIGKFKEGRRKQEVMQVEERSFGRVKTFKNSGRVVVEINEADIESYTFD